MPEPIQDYAAQDAAAPAPALAGKRTLLALSPILILGLTHWLGRYLPAALAQPLAAALSADVLTAVATGSALLAGYFRTRVGKSAMPSKALDASAGKPAQ